jgi:hypothetical protein
LDWRYKYCVGGKKRRSGRGEAEVDIAEIGASSGLGGPGCDSRVQKLWCCVEKLDKIAAQVFKFTATIHGRKYLIYHDAT